MQKIDDRNIVTPFTLRRLDAEAEEGEIQLSGFPKFFCIVYRGGSYQYLKNFNGNAFDIVTQPPLHQVNFGCRVSKLLNQQLHHNGHWLFAFTHSPLVNNLIRPGQHDANDWRRWILLWLDHEGDPMFTIDNIEGTHLLAAAPDSHWLEEAELAYGHWKHLMRDVLDPSADQLRPVAAHSA